MKNLVRLPIVVGVWWLVMEASSRLAKLDFVKELIREIEWLDRGRFTQGFLLLAAITLGIILLRSKFRSAGFRSCNFKDIFASMGIATMNDRVESIVTLLKEADSALYRSKEGGRNAISHCEDFQPVGIDPLRM